MTYGTDCFHLEFPQIKRNLTANLNGNHNTGLHRIDIGCSRGSALGCGHFVVDGGTYEFEPLGKP
jgi:hypothetical protein